MPCDAIICDWNGTITKDQDEKPILESIAVDLFKASIPWHPMRMVHILKARQELEALHSEKRRDSEFDFIIEMFWLYNTKIINGVPTSVIERSVKKYADKQHTLDKLDYRVLRPVDESHRRGKATGILSAGYRYGIQMILKAAGYDVSFDFCEANLLQERGGRVIGIDLNIYRNKVQLLMELLRERDIDEKRVMYLGDGEDDADCLEIVGHPIVAFHASDELKQRYARKYKAFIPRTEEDLARYFQDI